MSTITSISRTPSGSFTDPAPAAAAHAEHPSARRLSIVTDLPRGRRGGLTTAGLPRTVAHEIGVPTVHRTVVDIANFDHGATTPALAAVKEAVDKVSPTYGSVHRGAGFASRVTTGWFEEARAEVGRFVGARPGDEVIFTRNTTDALRLLAHALPSDALVFAWQSAHHAALLPWPAERTTALRVPKSTSEAAHLLRTALSAADPSAPKLVVLTGACNVTGEVWPVRELASIATQFGARVVVDGAQLVPHRAVDLEELGTDWIAFSGHKMYAPYGAGALVGRSDWLDAAEPYLPAGGATHTVSDEGIRWQTGPARHEGGTPNALGAIAIAAACATLTRHRETIDRHEEALATRLRSGLSDIPGVTIVSALGADRPNVGVVTFTVDGWDSSLVSQVLSDEDGIAVRDGRFCAHLLCDAVVGQSAAAVRASLGLATTLDHVDRLIAGVRRLVTSGSALPYRHVAGQGWEAIGDPRDLSQPRPW